jgi:tetratricopeptide (TPR) repeat protein
MKSRNKVYFLFVSIVIVSFSFFLNSCKTTKNTSFYRGWHNMNSRFNGYFLAREDKKETVKKIEKANREDFTKLLPVFIYPPTEAVKSYSSDFDKVIKRSTDVIQRHAIVTEKGKVEIANACKWIDECYTLIGISDLYKRELFPALEVFEYVSKKYTEPEARYTGILWMMKTYNELGSLSKTELFLDEIKNAKDFPKKKSFKKDLALITADYNIKRENYPAATKALSEAILLTRKKPEKARYCYLIAQLYTEMGDNKNALIYYSKVVKLHPTYDMAFSARIKRAGVYAAEQGDSKEIKRELTRMARDRKNEEFLDQIYYALAQITCAEKDTLNALKYLDKSIANSISNNPQKALSFLKRGDIYFDKQNYRAAEMNYDTAISVLPKDYPTYPIVESKKKSLTALVLNLDIIKTQDSLLTLAGMTEKERNRAIDNMIKQLKKEQARKEEEKRVQQERQKTLAQSNLTATNSTSANAAAWYFYNPNTISLGIADFNKKWGDRKLEDNWRRSQKPQENVVSDDSAGVVKDSVAQRAVVQTTNSDSIKDREFYLKDIPFSPEDQQKSTVKVIDAYYNVGVIYKEDLNNNKKSVQAFEELLKRYPTNKYKLTVYYQLYRSYLAMNNTPKADYYKNILLKDYPDTEYAKIIRSPNYAKDVMASKNQIENFYTKTYQYYLNGNYVSVIKNCNTADSLYSKSALMPQFDLLKALSIGKTQNQKALEAALTQVIIKHPIGPIKDRAQEILDLMNTQKNPVADTSSKKSAAVITDTTHYYWVTVVPQKKGDIIKFKEKVTLITESAFATDSLELSLEKLTNDLQSLVVKALYGRTRGLKYYYFMEDKPQVFSDIDKNTRQTFIISSSNYSLFQKDKDVKKYLQIFNEKLR